MDNGVKVFISHSKEDNPLVSKIISVFKKYDVEYWVDFEQIKDGVIMNKQINECLEDSSLFLLIWSKNAKKSSWVQAEIAALGDPQDPLIKKIIIFVIDNTRLPYPISGLKYRPKINNYNVELEIKMIIREHGSFQSQIILFKEDVRNDYENHSYDDQFKPVIREFKKFDGYHLYVPQSFDFLKNFSSDLSMPIVDSAELDNIVQYVEEKLNLARKNIAEYLADFTIDDIYNWVTKAHEKIDEKVKTRLEEKQNLILILGDYGSGKSGLCQHQMYRLCEEPDSNTIPLFIPLGSFKSYHKEENDNLFEEFCEYIKKEYLFNITHLDLLELMKKYRIVIIIDALDELTHRLDPATAQAHLEYMLKLSAIVPIILTCRHTYYSGGISKSLVFHPNAVRILDFDGKQIEHFLGLKFSGQNIKIDNIKLKINSDAVLKSIVKKPLFLNIFCDKFEIMQKLAFINEAVLFRTLTSGWLEHESKKPVQIVDPEVKRKDINQRCSERLAIIEYTSNNPVTTNKIRNIIEDEFEFDASNIETEFDSYIRYARDSTFLTVEELDSFRFLLKPFLEFFVASRIVRDIREYPTKGTVDNILLSLTPEIFQFIKFIIDLDWIIKHQALSLIPSIDNANVRKYLDWSNNLIKIVEQFRNKKKTNIKNVIRLLHMTNSLSLKVNLSNLNLDELNDRSLNLNEANLEGTSLVNAKLNGVNFVKANLKGAKLNKAELMGANFSEAKLNGANLTLAQCQRTNFTGARMTNVTCQETDFSTANLSGSDFNGSSIYDSRFIEANIVAADFTGAIISNNSFRSANLSRAEFADNRFGANDGFDSANLTDTKFVRFNRLPLQRIELTKRGAIIS